MHNWAEERTDMNLVHEGGRTVPPFFDGMNFTISFRRVKWLLNHSIIFFPLLLVFFPCDFLSSLLSPKPKVRQEWKKENGCFYRMHLMSVGRKRDRSLYFIFFLHAKESNSRAEVTLVFKYC